MNGYTYAFNNPVRFYDSDGRCFPYCYIFAYLAYRYIPRENLSMGARFVAGLNVPIVSDISALDVNATDNLWAAVNGDKCGLTTEQRIQAYLNYVDSSIKEAGSIYILYEILAGFREDLSALRPPKAAGSQTGQRLLSNAEVRQWYNDKVKSINTEGPATREFAEQVHAQRNGLKAEARAMMADRDAAARLDVESPLQPFEYYVRKYAEEGYTGEALWARIIQGGTTPNADVNKQFGIK